MEITGLPGERVRMTSPVRHRFIQRIAHPVLEGGALELVADPQPIYGNTRLFPSGPVLV